MTSDTLSTASPSSASAPSSAQAQTQTPRPATRRVVDATTRMLHWLMALSFTVAYITADGERWRLVHVTLGYTLAGLVVARVRFGFVCSLGSTPCAHVEEYVEEQPLTTNHESMSASTSIRFALSARVENR